MKQTDTATAALVQRVQEQFNTDIKTAENAVRKMQKALSAAMKAETQNKNAAETGDVTKRSIKRTKDIPWEEQIGSYLKKDGKIRHSDTLLLDATPKTLVSDGIVDLPLALPLSVLSKAQSGKDIYHSIKNKNIRKLQDGVRNAVLAIDNKDRNSIIFVTNIVQDGMPILVSFQQDEIFDGDRVHKATSIHLQKNVSNILQGLSKKSTVYVQNKNGLDAASGTLINQQRLNANIKFIDDKLSQKQTNVNSLFSESVPRVQSTKAQQEAKYLSLAEKYRNGTATLLETSEMQKMVDEAAQKSLKNSAAKRDGNFLKCSTAQVTVDLRYLIHMMVSLGCLEKARISRIIKRLLRHTRKRNTERTSRFSALRNINEE